MNSTDDALLFQRLHASVDAPDCSVAVLNLKEADARAYWNRSHEITHRLIEPPQNDLPFYRHRNDKQNPFEVLVDSAAAEVAFVSNFFLPVVATMRDQPLTWDLIETIRHRYAPTCTRLATVHAALGYSAQPTYLLNARMNGRRGRPGTDRALRVEMQGRANITDGGVFFYTNMRVPPSSTIMRCFETGSEVCERERLSYWITSSGSRLPDVNALTSAVRWRDTVFSLVSVL